jgi:Flp pilus assembly protein TadG
MRARSRSAIHPRRVLLAGFLGVGSRRGQSLVEMALILPILLLLVGGIIQFGMLFWTQDQPRSGSRSERAERPPASSGSPQI